MRLGLTTTKRLTETLARSFITKLSSLNSDFLLYVYPLSHKNQKPIPKKGNAKECSNYRTIALISHSSKIMLKILQARLQQQVNRELDVQDGSRKCQGNRIQVANILWIKKAREFQKNIYFCFIDYAKAFDSVDHNKLWEILKEIGISLHLTCLEKSVFRTRSKSQNQTWNNRLVPNRKRSTSRLYIVTLLI